MANLVCPVSAERVRNDQVRRIATLVFVLGVFTLVFAQNLSVVLLVSSVLAIDFFIRSFTSLQFSPLSFLSRNLENILKFSDETGFSDRAPKRFAAGLGFAFSVGIGASAAFGLSSAVLALSAALSVCAFLEAAFSVCLGCYVFVALKKIFPNI